MFSYFTPIPFFSNVKKLEKVYWHDADKSEWFKLEFFMYPDYTAAGSKYSRKFVIFKYGLPENCSDFFKG
jgi:hypothetical protein